MPYRMLCNDVQREGAKLSPDRASWLFCDVPLHKIWYGIDLVVLGDYNTSLNIRIDGSHTWLYQIMRELAVPFRVLYWLLRLLCFVAKPYYLVDFSVRKHLAAVPDGFLSTLAFLVHQLLSPTP